MIEECSVHNETSVHIPLPQGSGNRMEEKRTDYVKWYILDMTGPLHSWAHSSCDCQVKAAQEQASENSSIVMEGAQ